MLNQLKASSSNNSKKEVNSMLAHNLIVQLELEDSKLCNHCLDEYCENCFNESESEIEDLEEQDYDEILDYHRGYIRR